MKLPRVAPTQGKLLSDMFQDSETLVKILESGIDPAPGGRYLHWNNLRHRTPPPGLTHEEWWAGMKYARGSLLKKLPLTDNKSAPFRVGMPDPLLEMVQAIDRDASGKIELSEQVTNPATRDRYLISSLIDEAITSSQLEGAATTYTKAKDMIRSGRKPSDRYERMIMNNFRAMQSICSQTDQPLTVDVLCKLQHQLTLETLEDASAAGRFRREDEDVKVWDVRDGTLLHTPPPADQLPQRMAELCRFANEETPEFYVHPVVRATLLHFWIGYDHPFVDGNGRTARALFYWYMIRKGYWLCEFLAISRVLKKAPAKYMRAYLYSESDENDATYFVLFHLRVIRQAIRQLHEYLELKMSEVRETESFLRATPGMNHRQVALLSHALRHPDARYSIQSHQTCHGVVYQTARNDLLQLEDRRLLAKVRRGRTFLFLPADDLRQRLSDQTEPPRRRRRKKGNGKS